MSDLICRFDDTALNGLKTICVSQIAATLGEASDVARGVSAALRLARTEAVKRELCLPAGLDSNDIDSLLALAGFAADALERRIGSLVDATGELGVAPDGAS